MKKRQTISGSKTPKITTLIPRFAFLAIISLMGLGLSSCSFLLTALDNRGTFHNTTDLADLDSDGDLDVILVNVRSESESVAFHQITFWFNQGNGRFMPHLFQTPPYLYLSAAATDIDSDGDVDLALLRSDGVETFFNQGSRQVGEPAIFSSGHFSRPSGDTGTPGSLVLADLNNDGSLDGFVAGCCGMTFATMSSSIYLPPVSWVWYQEQTTDSSVEDRAVHLAELAALPIRDAAVGDLDGDGDLDVFTAVQAPKPGQNTSSADLVLGNDGSGNLTDSGQRLGENDSTAVSLGDLDGDGDLDALVGTSNGAVIWLNQGGGQSGTEGTYLASTQTIADGQISAVLLADLDGDDDLDALIAGNRTGIIWWNDGLGLFTRSDQQFHYSDRHGLAIGDFNNDGQPDIFAAAYDRDYRIWLNQGDGSFQSGP